MNFVLCKNKIDSLISSISEFVNKSNVSSDNIKNEFISDVDRKVKFAENLAQTIVNNFDLLNNEEQEYFKRYIDSVKTSIVNIYEKLYRKFISDDILGSRLYIDDKNLERWLVRYIRSLDNDSNIRRLISTMNVIHFQVYFKTHTYILKYKRLYKKQIHNIHKLDVPDLDDNDSILKHDYFYVYQKTNNNEIFKKVLGSDIINYNPKDIPMYKTTKSSIIESAFPKPNDFRNVALQRIEFDRDKYGIYTDQQTGKLIVPLDKINAFTERYCKEINLCYDEWLKKIKTLNVDYLVKQKYFCDKVFDVPETLFNQDTLPSGIM